MSKKKSNARRKVRRASSWEAMPNAQSEQGKNPRRKTEKKRKLDSSKGGGKRPGGQQRRTALSKGRRKPRVWKKNGLTKKGTLGIRENARKRGKKKALAF